MSEEFEARLKVNPLGPHPYMVGLPDHRRYEPTGMVDVLHGAVQDALRKEFGEPPSPPTVTSSWYDHIQPHTEFATVRWSEEDLDDSYEWEFLGVDVDGKNEGEWFSRSPLDYPYDG